MDTTQYPYYQCPKLFYRLVDPHMFGIVNQTGNMIKVVVWHEGEGDHILYIADGLSLELSNQPFGCRQIDIHFYDHDYIGVVQFDHSGLATVVRGHQYFDITFHAPSWTKVSMTTVYIKN